MAYPLLLILACAGKDSNKRTDDTSVSLPEHPSGTSEDDDVPNFDTALALEYAVAETSTEPWGGDPAWVGGFFGYRVESATTGEVLCEAAGDLNPLEGSTPALCPQCDWTFSLAVTTWGVGGDHCDAFGLDAGTLETWSADFGFAETYYMGGAFPLETALLIYNVDYYAWSPVFFNYYGEGYNTYDPGNARFEALIAEMTWHPYL